MRIAAVLDNRLSAGGGYHQAINAIDQMRRLCSGRYEFLVATRFRENLPVLEALGLRAVHIRRDWTERWLIAASMNGLLREAQARLGLTSALERTLEGMGVDLLYFVTPSRRCLALRRLNYVATVWDLSHRDQPEFPEVRANDEFLVREELYRNTLAQAICVLCDSTQLARRISERYGVDAARLLPMPFAPSPFLNESTSAPTPEVLQRHQLRPGYLFYPAQFWAHKNHIRILQCLALLKAGGKTPQLVLCGKDYGVLEYLRATAVRLGVQEQVRFLGFVESADLRGLYEGCGAVVMPTYFGPTNLPPLEAWSAGKPLIYSAGIGEQVGDAALLVDPDAAEDLALAVASLDDPQRVSALVERGYARLREIAAERAAAERELCLVLKRFEARRDCWRATDRPR